MKGRIDVEPEFAAALGLTVEECRELSLRALSDRAFDAGYEISVSSEPAITGKGHLTMRMSDERYPGSDFD